MREIELRVSPFETTCVELVEFAAVVVEGFVFVVGMVVASVALATASFAGIRIF